MVNEAARELSTLRRGCLYRTNCPDGHRRRFCHHGRLLCSSPHLTTIRSPRSPKGRTVRGTLCERANPSFLIWRWCPMWRERHMNPLTLTLKLRTTPRRRQRFFDAFGVVGVGLGLQPTNHNNFTHKLHQYHGHCFLKLHQSTQ